MSRRKAPLQKNREALQAHRELQYLRAAGASALHRRPRRTDKPVKTNAAQLISWVEERHDKLEALRGA